MQTKMIKCNLCNSDEHQALYRINRGGKKFNIVKCKKCGLVYINPQPTKDELARYYNALYSVPLEANKKGQAKKAREILKEISKHKQGKSLLEIGCSYGFLLDFMKKKGWRVKGVEISKEASNYAREKLGLDVFTGTLEECGEKEQFDVILMLDLVEHLMNPYKTLSLARDCLKSNGILILTTPNIDSLVARITGKGWEWMIPPEHLFYFSPITISSLLNKNNFNVISLKTNKGDARQPVFSIIQGLFVKIFYRYPGFLTSAKKNEEEKLKVKNLRIGYLCLLNTVKLLSSLIYFLCYPLFFILAKLGRAQTLLVVARKI